MAISDDLINFDLIETHKENIQSLPGGRSARQLASILSPLSSKGAGAATFDETKTLNDAIRQEYENELLSINDSDDPLDIYDRYVKWTLNAYPSAQATFQSQLLPLLERATKAFLTSSHYKNDPRYLKLWLHYIRFFSDSPRETFAFLARHHIGETLGLFYEEFATWLESAGRWTQAEEVYKMGIEREARPTERLIRKFQQFQQRFEARPQDANEPSSPALPTVRPALAAKIDPFAPTSRTDEGQASQQRNTTNAAAAPKPKKPKMAIFSDADSTAPAPSTSTTNGWDSIGSIKERKKENTVEAKPWQGETLKAGRRVGVAPKMEIFKDSNKQVRRESNKIPSPKSSSVPHVSTIVNARTGRAERAFVNMQAVCPNEYEEFSFEELRAMYRGWSTRNWKEEISTALLPTTENIEKVTKPSRSTAPVDIENLTVNMQENLHLQDLQLSKEEKPAKQRRTKIREIKQETQTVKTRLESPSSRKVKRKGPVEPTMTFHSKAATNEIYDIFNQASRSQVKDDTQSGDEFDIVDDGYSTAGESTGTGRLSGPSSEFGDDTLSSIRAAGREIGSSQSENASPWSDLGDEKHKLDRLRSKNGHKRINSEDMTSDFDLSQEQTQNSGFGGFDTQAIAAIADQDFENLDTKAIALMAGDNFDEQTEEDLKTPVEELNHFEIQNKARYLPLPPEDYEPTPVRPYRDPNAVAQNKLPFMTPIVERTESSLAPSTIFQHSDYYTSKTPSRSAKGFESPSKLNVEELLLSSPHRESPPSVKRKLERVAVEKLQIFHDSPPKKQLLDRDISNATKIKTVEQEVFTDPPAGRRLQDAAPIPEPKSTPASSSTHIRPTLVTKSETQTTTSEKVETKSRKGPIITDSQCNPCDPEIRSQVLASIHPPLASYKGFFDHSIESFNHHNILKTFADKIARQKSSSKASPRKINEKQLTKAIPPILKFGGTSRVYAVKRELGKGAFAPVYLVDSYDPSNHENSEGIDEPQLLSATDSDRHGLEALKTEAPSCTLVWEFHILRLLRQRLGQASRTMESIVRTHECHLYRDEAYLVLSYSSQGTLLDLVNLARNDCVRAGKAPEGLDEVLAMYLSLELLRIMFDLHQVGILHGDLKADNCLVRFDPLVDVTSSFNREGSHGWRSKGMCLIDFGRGIDVKCFKPDVKFVADWAASPQDCTEIRECRPWTYQIDYHGTAGVIHSLLFGKYIETVSNAAPSKPENENTENFTIGLGLSSTLSQTQNFAVHQTKIQSLKHPLKRYWEKEIWNEIFGLLMNPTAIKDGGTMPIQKNLKRVICKVEDWLEKESERSGRDLRTSLRKAERMVATTGGSNN